MSRRRLDELAERVAALEAAVASGDSPDLDARLAAIELGIRRLRHGDEDLDEIGEVLRRCSDLLDERVPAAEEVMVAWRGDPTLLTLQGRRVVAFPRPTGAIGERDFEHGAAAIAHLEAQRAQGIGFLLIPEPVHPWLARYPEFEEHLSRRYEVVADEEGVGMLVDVGSRRADDPSAAGLGEVLDRILDGERYAPVLDWTGFGLASLTADRGIFPAAPELDGKLPYLDRTIDVVVVEDPSHLEEGRRVATSAVVLVRPDGTGGVEVAEVEDLADDPSISAEAIPLFVAGADAEEGWTERVAEVAEVPASIVVSGRDPWARASEAESDLVAISERGALPLPGCIEAAAATLLDDERIGAVAVKLLDADGFLEAAGAAVFADGSAEGIGEGSADVSTPWHEYVRPVCAGSGLLVARTSALREAANGADSLLGLSAALWAAGYRLLYQPDAWAVRALSSDDDAEPGDAWEGVLASRPERPQPLDDAAWRTLLAHDDVEECWR